MVGGRSLAADLQAVAFLDNSKRSLNRRFHFGSADFILFIHENQVFFITSKGGSRTVMKKNVIALLLAVVLASGSIGIVPAVAAEVNAQESEPGLEEANATVEEVATQS